MAAINSKRFADRAARLVRGRKDFSVRRRISDAQVFSIICAMFVVAVGVGFFVYHDFMTIPQKEMVGMQVCLLFAVTMFVLATKYKKLHDTLQATEFLSATFVSALCLNYKFCMLTTPQGEIVYLDRAFQKMFPELAEQPVWTLLELFKEYHVPDEQSRRILQAVYDIKNEVIEMTIGAGADKQMQTIQLSIEPVPRPAGVILLRGK